MLAAAFFSSAAADEVLAILVQPAVIVAVAAVYLAETVYSVIDPSSQKSQVLLDHVLQIPPLRLERTV